MTLIRLHGILAKEYGNTFCFAVGNPRNVLEAIDCNRSGFKSRLIELHQEGFSYDIIIDKNYYPVKECEVSNKKHRPLGLGVQGLADVFFMLGIPYESNEAKLLNK